jgi:hypothetical protein
VGKVRSVLKAGNFTTICLETMAYSTSHITIELHGLMDSLTFLFYMLVYTHFLIKDRALGFETMICHNVSEGRGSSMAL